MSGQSGLILDLSIGDYEEQKQVHSDNQRPIFCKKSRFSITRTSNNSMLLKSSDDPSASMEMDPKTYQTAPQGDQTSMFQISKSNENIRRSVVDLIEGNKESKFKISRVYHNCRNPIKVSPNKSLMVMPVIQEENEYDPKQTEQLEVFKEDNTSSDRTITVEVNVAGEDDIKGSSHVRSKSTYDPLIDIF